MKHLTLISESYRHDTDTDTPAENCETDYSLPLHNRCLNNAVQKAKLKQKNRARRKQADELKNSRRDWMWRRLCKRIKKLIPDGKNITSTLGIADTFGPQPMRVLYHDLRRFDFWALLVQRESNAEQGVRSFASILDPL